eukprot:GHVU01165108.1.p3 GENE.GHVU01165108.1~~GHVU01165108.1.p3  ORF type:complete len:156 (-),score=19.60 GHVU01165108.1:95-562(-)
MQKHAASGKRMCTCGDNYGRHGAQEAAKCEVHGSRSQLKVGAIGIQSVYYLGATHMGCFKESEKERELPFKIVEKDANMTVPKCVSSCADKGFPLAGIQDGSSCHCRYDAYMHNSSIIQPRSDCSVPCAGKSITKLCGGETHHDVFRISTARTSE